MNHAFRENRILCIAVLTVTLFVVMTLEANGAEHLLFLGSGDQHAAEQEAQELVSLRAVRLHKVNLNPALKSPAHITKGDRLILGLFDKATYTANIDRVVSNINGTVSVRGRINGYPSSYVLISTTGERSLGSIRIPEKGQRYIIQSGLDGMTHYLVELDVTNIDELEDGPSLIPPITVRGTYEGFESIPLGGPLDPALIDVMVVYTPAARQWADDNSSGIANVIAQAMEEGQLALDNSGTFASIQLVHSAEVSYVEDSNSLTNLNRLTSTNDGYIDVVHSWRDTYGADLVDLFTVVEDWGGYACRLNSALGEPERGFSVTRVQQVATGYTLIHEMGHNMGCGHYKWQVTQPGRGLFSYSAGWRWTGNDNGKYCSVMSYPSDGDYIGTRVAHFSNPSILYQGVATGDAADGDNARTIRETKHVVAAYRRTTFTASEDTMIRENDPNGNYGGADLMYVCGISDPSYILIKFDLSSIPAGSIIDYVELNMFSYGYYNPPNDLLLAKVASYWTESNVTWNKRPSIYLDNVAECHDFGDIPMYSWKSTDYPNLKTAVQDWVDNPNRDYGLWMHPCGLGMVLFRTSESNPETRPKLIVNYTVPTGSLTVTIEPSEVRGSARWRLMSGPDTNWKQSGDTIGGLGLGNYTLTFNEVSGWNKPSDQTITIAKGSNTASGTYTQPTYNTLSLYKSGNGSIRVNGTLRSMPWSETFMACTNVTIEAVADSEWQFYNWSGNLSGSANPTSIQMDGDKNVTASFHYPFGGHSGTEQDPYLISTINDWQNLTNASAQWDKYFILTANLDLQGITLSPVGNPSTPFIGVFDGNGHIIHNAVLNMPGIDYVSLFGCLGTGGQIKNLGVEEASIFAADCVGSLVGRNDGTVINCYSTQTVGGKDCVGGLVGSNFGTISDSYSTGLVSATDFFVGGLAGENFGTVNNCHSTGSVSATDYSVGGLVGRNDGNIRNCYSTGDVSGGSDVGGLVGYNEGGTISNCYSTGSLSGDDGVGGLVGYNYGGTISNCYSTGSLSGSSSVGGLVGRNGYYEQYCDLICDEWGNCWENCWEVNYPGWIYECYSTSKVSGGSGVGGLVGVHFAGEVRDSFWDTETSEQSTSAGGTPKTTAEMKTQSTFTSDGWDFVNVWDICEGTNYPRFIWQIPSADLICPDGVGFEDFSYLADGWQMEFGINDLMSLCEQWLTGR